jgi:hypothetical protein
MEVEPQRAMARVRPAAGANRMFGSLPGMNSRKRPPQHGALDGVAAAVDQAPAAAEPAERVHGGAEHYSQRAG